MKDIKDAVDDILKKRLTLNPDGYFELHKSISSVSNSKKYMIHSLEIDKRVENKISKEVNLPDYFFCIFLCLMMRYTQNEILTGISLKTMTDNLIVSIVTLQYDSELTFKRLMNLINKEKETFFYTHSCLDDILVRTADYNNCLFVYSDSFDGGFNVSQMNIKTDICFQIEIKDDKNILNIIFNENVYNKDTIERVALHYDKCLTCVLQNPEITISNINYLNADEEAILIDKWNRTEYQFPKGYCIHQLFEQRVMESPDEIAVYYKDKTMTRGILNKRANQLAHLLLHLGVKQGEVIAIYSDKSIDFIIGIMGILKAGCAYLPIDTTYPQSRVEYIVTNSKVSVMLTTTKIENICSLVQGLSIVNLNHENNDLDEYPDFNPNVNVASNDPCYLIYTSGSTGQPKGVLLNHEGRINNFCDFNSRFSITSNDKVLAISSVSFDMSAYDILGSMIVGSGIVLPDPLLAKQPFHWLELIEKYNVTIWHSVPVLLDLLCKCYRHRKTIKINSIRLVLLGGDWIPVSLPGDFREINNKALIVSLGGATEVSMDSIIYLIENINPDWKSIPYGKPMRNQKAYVLDKNRQLMPIGFPGELYLGGVGVGDGYYLNPEATNKHFFQNPWVDDPKAKIYKTGDLAFFEPDGTIILLGRMDFQVKINGTRVGLGEIEHCLLNYKGIKQAVAVAYKAGVNTKIAVYVEYQSEKSVPTENELIQYLANKLPKSHIPAHIVLTNSIPVTPNGKIDRKILEKLTDDYFNYSNIELRGENNDI